MHVTVLRPHLLDRWQLSALGGSRDADAAPLPGVAALLQASVVQFAAATQHKCQCPLLLGSGYQLVFVGLAHRAGQLLIHSSLFCLIGMHPATRRTIRPCIPWLKTRGCMACLL